MMRWLMQAIVSLALMFVVARGVMLFGETMLGASGVSSTHDAPRVFG